MFLSDVEYILTTTTYADAVVRLLLIMLADLEPNDWQQNIEL